MNLKDETANPGSARWRAVLLLGGATGLRSMSPVAALSLTRTSSGLTLLKRPAIKKALIGASIGELVLDKLPIPARTNPLSLALRALNGSLVGVAVSDKGDLNRAIFVSSGLGVAVVATYAGAAFRKRLTKVSGEPVAGLVEDALTFLLITGGCSQL